LTRDDGDHQNAKSATQFCGSAMVRAPIGGRKKKFLTLGRLRERIGQNF